MDPECHTASVSLGGVRQRHEGGAAGMRDADCSQLCLARIYVSNIVISSTIDNRRQCGTAACHRPALFFRLTATDMLTYNPSLPRQDLLLEHYSTSTTVDKHRHRGSVARRLFVVQGYSLS